MASISAGEEGGPATGAGDRARFVYHAPERGVKSGSMAQAGGPRGDGRARRAVAGALAAAGMRGSAVRLIGPGEVLARAGPWWREALRDEIDNRRLFPWAVVAYGAGILLAFAADGPLSLWPPLVVGGALAVGAIVSRAHLGRQVALVAAAALFLGFAAAVARMHAVAAPVLGRPTIAAITGFVESVEERAGGGARLTLRPTVLGTLPEPERPTRIRVTVRKMGDLAPGQAVHGTARLMPPPEAARPGGYDFARDAFFRGIGAVGSVSGRLQPAADAARPDYALRWAARVDAARNGLTRRIADTVGGQAGAVSAALVTGKRGLIDERTNDVLRGAGIYHVVSISGLHMVLAAGVFFSLARALLALSPALALNWPIKKLAALVGMAGATGYCVFSGAEVATERSLVMILVMQGAILVDRPAMSFRNLALSALLVLTREPEALLGPSFQMSYAAVAGLIVLAEALRRWRSPPEPGDPVRRVALAVGGVVLGTVATTLVATAATAPFGTFHFQGLQPFGLIGNAATLPLVSFAVMPAAVLGVLALPFGLDAPVWSAMGWAVAVVLRLAAWVAALPNATVVTPAFGGGALMLLVCGLLLATLPGWRLRPLALVPTVMGLAAAAGAERPDFYVARDGSGAAIRGADGRLTLVGPVATFTAEQWLRADGDSRRAADRGLRDAARCDRVGCTAILPDGRAIAVSTDRRGLAKDCRRAAILVTRFAVPPGCGADIVLDRTRLASQGATTLRLSGPGYEMRTARRPGQDPPWRATPSANPAQREPPSRVGEPVRPPSPGPADGDQDEGSIDAEDWTGAQ